MRLQKEEIDAFASDQVMEMVVIFPEQILPKLFLKTDFSSLLNALTTSHLETGEEDGSS